jgi:hypothetical protein
LRYTEASLVRALESNGVGRPSTYAQIIGTLLHRKYVTRQKRSLHATDLGMEVSTLLVTSLGKLFDVTFTASMEDSLDAVEKGDVEWTQMLGAFFESFQEWMSKARGPAADRDEVGRILTLLEGVQTWAPEVRRGKRVYSDHKFVESLGQDYEGGAKEISQRQLQALTRIAARYREQVPQIEAYLRESGRAEMLDEADSRPPRDETLRKLELLGGIELDDRAKNFVDSLRARTVQKRALTDAQIKALNNVVLSRAGQIADFDAIKGELDLVDSEVAEDTESRPLLDAMAAVSEWKAPVVRGKRVFNDQLFYESLRTHFDAKGFLSPRQRGALKKMVARYREQIPDYAELAEQTGLRTGPRAKR